MRIWPAFLQHTLDYHVIDLPLNLLSNKEPVQGLSCLIIRGRCHCFKGMYAVTGAWPYLLFGIPFIFRIIKLSLTKGSWNSSIHQFFVLFPHENHTLKRAKEMHVCNCNLTSFLVQNNAADTSIWWVSQTLLHYTLVYF